MRTLILLLLSCLPVFGQVEMYLLSLPRGTNAPPAATNSPLVTNLVAYWRLNEESGDRYSAITGNTNTMFDTNTCLFTNDVVSAEFTNAAWFHQPSSEYLNAFDGPDISMGDIDFTVACWVFPYSSNASYTIVGKGTNGSAGNSSEFALHFLQNAANPVRWTVGNGGASGTVQTNATANYTLGAWHLLVGYHDAANNKIGISFDGGGAIEANYTTGSYDSDGNMTIGSLVGAAFCRGGADEVGVWKRKLSADEIGVLWNAGNGRTYPW